MENSINKGGLSGMIKIYNDGNGYQDGIEHIEVQGDSIQGVYPNGDYSNFCAWDAEFIARLLIGLKRKKKTIEGMRFEFTYED